jgi:amino acid adenylation domain-containing protein
MMNISTLPLAEETSATLAEAMLAAMAANPAGRIYAANGQGPDHATMLGHVAALRLGYAGLAAGAVAVCTAKTPYAIAAILAAMAEGRAYAPLDPAHPDARLFSILEMVNPANLIVDPSTAPRLQSWAQAAGVPQMAPRGVVPVGLPQPQPAAVLHTSGSTGQPKQVRIGAEAIAVFCAWVRQEFGLGPQDCVLSHAPLAFDLSFLDVFASLSAGASLALADTETARSGERLLRLIAETGVSVVQAAPSALALIARAAGGQCFPNVRLVMFAGEPMPAATLQDLFKTFPKARITNIYGCTETNDTFFYDVPRVDTPDPLPLGQPLPYVRYLIVDPDDKPVAMGEEGELWVRCPTMMQGYSDPVLTAKAHAIHAGQTYYRSNDRVRIGPDGALQFLGRADTVQKINGNRVDLAEVEACLLRIKGIREAAVFVVERDGAKQLECAVASDDSTLTSLSLRLAVMQSLPAAAIPRRYSIRPDALPKNSNGKICRRILASLALAA